MVEQSSSALVKALLFKCKLQFCIAAESGVYVLPTWVCVWSTGGNQCFYEFMNIVWGRHKGKRLCITLLFSNCTHWAPHTCHSLYGRGHHIKLHSCIWSVLGNPHDLWNVTLLNFTFISQCSIFQFKVLFVLSVLKMWLSPFNWDW